jgi:hypothetical protein
MTVNTQMIALGAATIIVAAAVFFAFGGAGTDRPPQMQITTKTELTK